MRQLVRPAYSQAHEVSSIQKSISLIVDRILESEIGVPKRCELDQITAWFKEMETLRKGMS